jgi:hypothetical protein
MVPELASHSVAAVTANPGWTVSGWVHSMMTMSSGLIGCDCVRMVSTFRVCSCAQPSSLA